MKKWKLILNKAATGSSTGFSNPKHSTAAWISKWTQRHRASKTNKLHGLSPQANYTDRATPLVGQVSANFCG
jgi:hypothetical protein